MNMNPNLSGPQTTHETIYAEFTEDPASWSCERPSFDADAFNLELERAGGYIGSVPRFRLRWCGKVDDYCIEEFPILTGYTYREDGLEKFVSCTELTFEFPKGSVPAPRFELTKVYIPRWVIEEYQEPFYSGVRYIEWLELVEEKAGHVTWLSRYREPLQKDLDIIKGALQLGANLTQADIQAGILKESEQRSKIDTNARIELKEETKYQATKMLYDGVPEPKMISLPSEIKSLAKEQRAKV